MTMQDQTLATKIDADARTALKRVEQSDEDYAAPPVPYALPDQLHRMGTMTSTLRWEAVIPTALPESPERSPDMVMGDDELARAVLDMPNVITELRALTARALADCETHGLHPIGLHLRTGQRSAYGPRHRSEETVLTLSVRAVDKDRLADVANG